MCHRDKKKESVQTKNNQLHWSLIHQTVHSTYDVFIDKLSMLLIDYWWLITIDGGLNYDKCHLFSINHFL